MNTTIAINKFATLDETVNYINLYSNKDYIYKIYYDDAEYFPYTLITKRRYDEIIFEKNINEIKASTITELFNGLGISLEKGLELANISYGTYICCIHGTNDKLDEVSYLIFKKYGIEEKKVKEMMIRERDSIDGKREKD